MKARFRILAALPAPSLGLAACGGEASAEPEPSDMEEVCGKGFEELYRDREVWNLAKCGELGIRLDPAKADAEKAS